MSTSTETPTETRWYRDLHRVVVPVLDESGNVHVWAVVALHEGALAEERFLDMPWAGVIALVKRGPAGRDARRYAGWIANDPDLIDVPEGGSRSNEFKASVIDLRDNRRFAPVPRDFPEFDTSAYWDLMGDLNEFILPAVQQHLTPLDPLRIYLEHICSEDDASGNDERPAAAVVAQAHAIVWALDESERRKLFNGWRYPAEERLDSKEVIPSEMHGMFQVRPYLMMRRLGLYEPKDVLQWTVAEDDTHKIELRVLVGTRKAETIAAVRDLAKQLDRDWNKLTAMRPDGKVEEGVVRKRRSAKGGV